MEEGRGVGVGDDVAAVEGVRLVVVVGEREGGAEGEAEAVGSRDAVGAGERERAEETEALIVGPAGEPLGEREGAVVAEGGAEGEGVKEDGQFPVLLSASAKSLSVWVHTAPPVPAVTPMMAVLEAKKSARLTRKSCVPATSVGDSVRMCIAQPQAS